ncbi:MAG TPA: hypothetical protein VH393_07980, partial [Ktedonobacterales bacterium]
MATIPEELESLLARLSEADQRRLLEYARALASAEPFPRSPLPPGSPPEALLRIRVSPEIGEAMERALEERERDDLEAQLIEEEEQNLA